MAATVLADCSGFEQYVAALETSLTRASEVDKCKSFDLFEGLTDECWGYCLRFCSFKFERATTWWSKRRPTTLRCQWGRQPGQDQSKHVSTKPGTRLPCRAASKEDAVVAANVVDGTFKEFRGVSTFDIA